MSSAKGLRRVICTAAVTTAALFGGATAADAHIFISVQSGSGDGGKIWRTNLNGGQLATNFVGTDYVDNPVGLTVRGSTLYYANSNSATIGRATIGSGNTSINPDLEFITESDAADLSPVGAMTSYGNSIYWLNDPDPASDPPFEDPEPESIARATLAPNGDVATIDLDFITDVQEPNGLTVNGNTMYWTEQGPERIGRAFLDAAGNVIDGNENGDTQDDPDHFFVIIPPDPDFNQPDDIVGVAATGNYLFWTDWRQGGVIGRVTIGTDGVPDYDSLFTDFISGQSIPRGIATDGANVYWANILFDNSIGRATIDGDLVGDDEAFNEFINAGALPPYGIAIQRVTSSDVSCTPAQAGKTTQCTATVTDDDLGTPTSPRGTVAFSTDGSGLETPTCNLAPSGNGVSKCAINHALAAGGETITAAYGGQSPHGGSTDSTPHLVPLPADGSAPPPPPPGPDPAQVAQDFAKAIKKCKKKKSKKKKKKCKKKVKKAFGV